MDVDLYSSILGAIYDTPASYENWGEVLRLLKGAFGCHAVTLIEQDRRVGASQFAETGLGSAVAQEYFKNWHYRNIFYGEALNWRPGAAQTDQEILPRSELLQSDYYNEFLRRYDMRGFIGMTIVNDSAQRLGISMLRPPPGDDFDGGEVLWAARLMPHLQNAARIARRLAESKVAANAPFSLLEFNPTGILLLGRTGASVFANRTIRAMASQGDGFVMRRDRIEANRPSENAKLQALIAGALGTPPTFQSPRGGAMRISRRSGARDYVATVGGLQVSSRQFSDAGAVAFVLVSDLQAATSSPAAILRQVYGLTAAETRLAECLGRGESIDAAAERLQVKSSTAKWHLHALFQKTGVARQSELIHLLLSLPWAGGQENV